MEGDASASASHIFVTTNIAACTATCATMIVTWLRYKKPDVSMTLNGTLAGLVAITAGCDMVSTPGAAVIGIIAGVAVVFAVEFFDKVLKVDDPVGAVSVHGICGALGTILTGFFSVSDGLLYGKGAGFLGVQCLGVVSVIAWVAVTMTIVFAVLKRTVGLRVSEEEEILGLDVTEHGLTSAYADFTPSHIDTAGDDEEDAPQMVPAARPVSHENRDAKLTEVTIITRQSKFQALKHALNEIGVTGITVTNVMGCGMQKGENELYRGTPVEMTVLPKVKVDVVVSKVPVSKVVETAKRVLYTGRYGDGKIFVQDVENAIKVRTGEEGYDALQDEE